MCHEKTLVVAVLGGLCWVSLPPRGDSNAGDGTPGPHFAHGARGREGPPVTGGASGSRPLPALYYMSPGDRREVPEPCPGTPEGAGGHNRALTAARGLPRSARCRSRQLRAALRRCGASRLSLSGTVPFASLSGSVAPRQPACAACLTAGVARPRWFATGSRWRGPVGTMDVGELLSYQVSSGGWAVLGVSRSPALWPPARRCPRPWPRCGGSDAAPAPVRPRAWGGRRAGPTRPHSVHSHGAWLKCRQVLGVSPPLQGAVLGGTGYRGLRGAGVLPLSFRPQMRRLVPACARSEDLSSFHGCSSMGFSSLLYDKTNLISFLSNFIFKSSFTRCIFFHCPAVLDCLLCVGIEDVDLLSQEQISGVPCETGNESMKCNNILIPCLG